MGFSKSYRNGFYHHFLCAHKITGQTAEENVDVITPPLSYLHKQLTSRDFEYILRKTVQSVPVCSPDRTDEVFTPVIDKFSWRDAGGFIPDNTFFIRFKKLLTFKRLFSFLVNYFAKCEQNNLPYSDPEFPDEILINRADVQFSKTQDPMTFYHLNGGHTVFDRIMQLDKEFLLCISELADEPGKLGFFGFPPFGIRIQMSKIDFCIKLTERIMPRIGDELKRGRVWGGSCHLYGIGKVNNKRFSDRVGRQSWAYKQKKNSGPQYI